jgi:hypothetical protein
VLECRLAPAVIGVDAGANVHAISPLIYGSSFASTTQLSDLHLTLNRDGGNASDTYNYPQDATNHGSDWYFESIAYGNGTGNGQGIDSFISSTQAGGAQPSITLNLFDWAANLAANGSDLGSFSVSKYGAQQAVDPYATNWGNGVLKSTGKDVTGNDPNDAYVPNSSTIEQAWIQHLIATFGSSQNGGVDYYTLGNEPGLWNSTHRDIHPAGDTLTELRDRMIDYASMVKSLDPNAQILGPEEWGWTNYFIDGADSAAQNWGATYNGLNAEQWLLDQLHQHDVATGQRLLDYFTLHYYPQSGEYSNDVSTNMELLRNRSTRSLWDPNYVDASWIGSTGVNGGVVELIPLMRSWVNAYYSGTKLGITEYNWGADGDMNGATTQADVWGIFGREGLDLANRWGTPDVGTPTYLAMKMYRNYDSNGAAFGDTSVSASVGNPDQVDAFAATRSSDGALTVMVINKNLFDPNHSGLTTPITINLSNFAALGTAQEWQLAGVNGDQTNAAITRLSDVSDAGGSITVNVPMESVTLFVIPGHLAAPSGLTASAGQDQVTLSWNTAAGATSYNVYRGTASGGETLLTTGVTGTTYTDTGLTAGTTYYYQVSAVSGANESPLAAEKSATPYGPISGTNSTVAFATPTVGSGQTDVVTFVLQDGAGNAATGLAGSAFALSLSGGTSEGSFGAVVESATPGTYTATFTGTTVGTASTLTATVSGVALAGQPTITVTPGPVSTTNSTAAFATQTVAAGQDDVLTLVIEDSAGNAISGLAGSAFGLSLSGGTSIGSFGGVTETATPGTYTATVTGTTAGTVATLTATVNGVSLTGHPALTVTSTAWFADDFKGSGPNKTLAGPWTVQGGSFQVDTLAATATGKGLTDLATVSTISNADEAVFAGVTVPTGKMAGLVARYAGPQVHSMYVGQVVGGRGTYTASLLRNVRGVWTTLFTHTYTGAVTDAALEFDVVASSLRLFFNGGLIAYANDRAVTAAGAVGMRSSTGAVFQNFSASPLTLQNSVSASTFSDDFKSTIGPNQQLSSFWLNQAGNFQINTANGTATAIGPLDLATVNGMSSADETVSATVSVAAGQEAGLAARYAGPGNQNEYVGQVAGENGKYTASLLRNVRGVWTTLFSHAYTGSVSGAALELDVVGSSLRLLLNDSIVAYARDTAVTAAGTVGMRASAGAVFQNFGAVPLTLVSQPLPFSDNFTPLPNGQLSNSWFNQVGNVANPSGAAQGVGGMNLATVNGASAANVTVQADITLSAVGQTAGLVARYSGAGDRNMYYAAVAQTGANTFQARLLVNRGGVWTLLKSQAVGSGSGTLKLTVSGNSLTVSYGGTDLFTVINSAISAAGGVGLRLSAGATADNFQAG